MSLGMFAALPGNAEDVWSALPRLHRKRVENRSIGVGTPQSVPTIETYERHLINRIIPRWGRLAPLAVESRNVEAWFRELSKGSAQKKVKPLFAGNVTSEAEGGPENRTRSAAPRRLRLERVAITHDCPAQSIERQIAFP